MANAIIAHQLRYGGIHTQQDRDRRRLKGEKCDWYMLRIKLKRGRMRAADFLALDRLSRRYSHDGSLRFTAGQNAQLHGLELDSLRDAVSDIRTAGLALGCHPNGQEYNLASPLIPLQDARHRYVAALGQYLCDSLYPRANAGLADAVLPSLLGGDVQLALPAHPPRKFTLGLALPEDNSADVYAQDLGFILDQRQSGRWVAQVLAGGGLTLTRGKASTFAALATPLGEIDADDIPRLIDATAALVRQRGELEDRFHGRLKYLLAEHGAEWLKARLYEYSGLHLRPMTGLPKLSAMLGPAIGEQGNGLYYRIVDLPAGRLHLNDPLRQALVEIAQQLSPTFIATADQRLILANLSRADLECLDSWLPSPSEDALQAMSCVGPSTCNLAVTESERVLAQIERPLRQRLAELGRDKSAVALRVAGCPIGCIRPYAADIGIIGVRRDRYDIYLGGEPAGARLGQRYAENVSIDEIIPQLDPILEEWAAQANEDQSLGNYFAAHHHQLPKAIRLDGRNQLIAALEA